MIACEVIMVGSTRKLNQVRNSYYIYLPKEWCARFGLDKNAEVHLEETSDGSLIVSPTSIRGKSQQQVKFWIKDVIPENIENILVGAYVVGVSQLMIEFESELEMDTREAISGTIRRLPGFEILDERRNSILVSDTSEKQVVIPVLKRQFATAKYMLHDLHKMMESGEPKRADKIIDRDDDVDRHRYFVERLAHLALQDPSYARRIGISPEDCLHFSLAAKYIERIADHICSAARQFRKVKAISKKIVNQTAKLVMLYDKTFKNFFAIDSQRKKYPKKITEAEHQDAFDSLSESEKVLKGFTITKSSTRTTSAALVILLLHLERIASYCQDIGEVAINRTIESRTRMRDI